MGIEQDLRKIKTIKEAYALSPVLLSEKERDFISNIEEDCLEGIQMTMRQWRWMNDIFNRIE